MPNSSYEQRKQDVIEEITAAFNGVSREGGVSLHEAWVIDDCGNDKQRAKARKKDTETRWQDVPDEDISRGDSCLCFLDEIGFRYYIPAYVVWYLRHVDNKDPNDPIYHSSTFDALLFALTDDFPDMHDYCMSRFKQLTHDQSQAVAHFLEFDAERVDTFNKEYEHNFINPYIPDNDARRAVERYWRQFL